MLCAEPRFDQMPHVGELIYSFLVQCFWCDLYLNILYVLLRRQDTCSSSYCLLYIRFGTCDIVIAVRSTHVVLHFIEDHTLDARYTSFYS